MPAYFEKGSNVAVLQSQEVIYRVPLDKNLGFIELFAPPWNNRSAVLLVAGTTTGGVASAGNALTSSTMRDSLRGNFVTVDGQQTFAVDTRTGLGLGRLGPGLAPVGTPDLSQTNININTDQIALAAAESQRMMVLIGVVGIFILIVLMLIVAIWLRSRRQKRTR
jgi:hypothetical protein